MTTARLAGFTLLAQSALIACQGTAAPLVAVAVAPQAPSVVTGASMTFTATVTGTADTAVSWSVPETSGCGSVIQSGLYSAPSAPSTCHVVATSAADSSRSASATVTVSAIANGTDWPTVCASEPIPTSGVYYFCNCGTGAAAGCVNGSDSNAGTQASPWQTWNKVNTTWRSLQAGQMTALCNGGAWDISSPSSDGSWANSNATAGSPITMRNYNSPAFSSAARPRLYNGGINQRNNAYQRWINLTLDGLSTVAWGSYGGSNVPGAPAHDMTFCNDAINNYTIGLFFGDAAFAEPNVSILGCTFDNNSQDAILTGGLNQVIDGNVFTHNGGSSFNHTIYLSEGDNIQLINNRIVGPGVGDSPVVVHGHHQNLLVENNVLDQSAGSTGWNWDLSGGGYPSACGLPGLIFRRNRVIGTNNVGAHIESAPNAIIEDNIFIMNGAGGGNGFDFPNTCSCGGGCDTTSNLIVRNNTIYLPNGNNGTGVNIAVGSGNVVTSNVIHGSGSFKCFSSGAFYATEDYNLCTGSWGRTPGAHDLTSQPLFTGPLSPATIANFIPAVGSPLIGAASTVAGQFSGLAANSVGWSATDAPKARVASPTDIGAYEH